MQSHILASINISPRLRKINFNSVFTAVDSISDTNLNFIALHLRQGVPLRLIDC